MQKSYAYHGDVFVGFARIASLFMGLTETAYCIGVAMCRFFIAVHIVGARIPIIRIQYVFNN